MRGRVRSAESAAGLCAKCRVRPKHRSRTGLFSEWCRDCINQASRDYSAAHRDSTRRHGRESARRRKYGLNPQDCVDMLAAQDNRCDICGAGLSMEPHTKPIPHIDHDHSTGALRSILCIDCNRLLGAARDSVSILEAAIDYLRRYGK